MRDREDDMIPESVEDCPEDDAEEDDRLIKRNEGVLCFR